MASFLKFFRNMHPSHLVFQNTVTHFHLFQPNQMDIHYKCQLVDHCTWLVTSFEYEHKPTLDTTWKLVDNDWKMCNK